MGYHALTKPVLFFAAGNIHQTLHSLEFRVIGPGLMKRLPLTALLMALAAIAAIGLPPFGMFFSELTVISGGIAAGKITVSVLILVALVASFCGILRQFTRILPGTPKREFADKTNAVQLAGVPAMALLLGALLVFSVWLPSSLQELLRQAADIIEGKR
jgi:hydrogenase-4 component F